MTDGTVWKQAIVSDGFNIKDPSQDEFKLISTSELKAELTEKVDRALSKGLPISKSSAIVPKKYPPGVKVHMFKEVTDLSLENKRNFWQNIYTLMGMKTGRN